MTLEFTVNVESTIPVEIPTTTLYDFLMYHTKVGELCVIRLDGYIINTAYIDHEDLFISSISDEYKYKYVVKNDEWGELGITNSKFGTNSPEEKVAVPCHYIDICHIISMG